jgi:hypothetical protein
MPHKRLRRRTKTSPDTGKWLTYHALKTKANHYRDVLRKIGGNDPEANRQAADALAVDALDKFGDLF